MNNIRYPESTKTIKKGENCDGTDMTSWGIGDGRPPFTSDPENPMKPFAHYKGEE